MNKRMKSSKKNKFPRGWGEARIRRLIQHYENQSDDAAAKEDDSIFAHTKHTFMRIPAELVPAVRKLLRRKAG